MTKPTTDSEASERPATLRENGVELLFLLPFLVGLVISTLFGCVIGTVLWIVFTCVGSDRLVVNIGMRSIIYLVLMAILFPIFGHARAKARAISCLSNTKQVTLSTLLYAQDYDGVFPRSGPSGTELVAPYLPKRAFFTCPIDPKGTVSYTFNSNLAGLSPANMAWPDKTALIYEGKAGKLNYHHGDHASIGFVDGHCKLITAPDTTSLFWTAQALPTAPPPPIVPPTNVSPIKDKGTAKDPESGGPAYMR